MHRELWAGKVDWVMGKTPGERWCLDGFGRTASRKLPFFRPLLHSISRIFTPEKASFLGGRARIGHAWYPDALLAWTGDQRETRAGRSMKRVKIASLGNLWLWHSCGFC